MGLNFKKCLQKEHIGLNTAHAAHAADAYILFCTAAISEHPLRRPSVLVREAACSPARKKISTDEIVHSSVIQ